VYVTTARGEIKALNLVGVKKKAPLVSILIGTRDRLEPLMRCLQSVRNQQLNDFEVLILDDCSQQVDVARQVRQQLDDARIVCFRSARQLGVAGGRNYLIQRARGEILVFLDDDAVFEDSRCLQGVVEKFQPGSAIGILAFKIVNHLDGRSELMLPFSRLQYKTRPELIDSTRLVSYYNGGGNAIHRNVIRRCGLYQDDFMFFGEELELAYRIVGCELAILYCPDIVVHHYPAHSNNSDRKQQRDRFYYSVRNVVWLAYKFLPLPYMLTYLLVWVAYYGVEACKTKQLRNFLSALNGGFAGTKNLVRAPLNKKAIAYLKQNFGRLWY